MKKVALILAGGRGERFWPRSRSSRPKQFLNIVNPDKSMIRMTYERVSGLVDDVFVVVSPVYKDEVLKHIPEIGPENIILEPMPRNTAPAIGLSAVVLREKYGDGTVMLVLPSDHYIREQYSFELNAEVGMDIAVNNDVLVLFGIVPTRPETGYGYIKVGNHLGTINTVSVYDVDRFVEKPDIETAQMYLSQQDYLWNSGMFAWKVGVILEEIEKHMPELFESLMTISEALGTPDEEEVKKREFEKLEKISIDYGVLEKSGVIQCVKADMNWDDIGSWEAVYREYPKDSYGNAVMGPVISFDTYNSLIYSDPDGVVAVIGLNRVVVVKDGDAVLVMQFGRGQEVKKVLEEMKKKDRFKKFL